MDGTDADYQRAMVLAEMALDHLKRNRIPPNPHNFAVWFARAADRMARIRGAAAPGGAAPFDDSGDGQAGPPYGPEAAMRGYQLEQMEDRVTTEIDGADRVLSEALAGATGYGDALRSAIQALETAADGHAVRAIVDQLARSTGEAEQRSQLVRRQLADAKLEMATLQDSLEAIRHESLTDQLTTLGNRKLFDASLEAALEEARSTGQPLSLILTDIDHFKAFNDCYGHQTGDQVLRLVAMAMKQVLKHQDVPCRYGGEEFAVILPRTALAEAVTAADHVRAAVAGRELIRRSTSENLGRVTVSVGVASFRYGDTAQALVERTDACLYRAKADGRNTVAVDWSGIRPRDVA